MLNLIKTNSALFFTFSVISFFFLLSLLIYRFIKKTKVSSIGNIAIFISMIISILFFSVSFNTIKLNNERKRNFIQFVDKAYKDYDKKNYDEAYMNFIQSLNFGKLNQNHKSLFYKVVENKVNKYIENKEFYKGIDLLAVLDKEEFKNKSLKDNLKNKINREKTIELNKLNKKVKEYLKQNNIDKSEVEARKMYNIDPYNSKTKENIEIIETKKNDREAIRILKKEINLLRKFNSSMYRANLTNLAIEYALFNEEAKTIRKYEDSGNKEIRNLAKMLKNELIRIQVREFPLMRKEISGLTKELMTSASNYISNVYGMGRGYNNIRMTGLIFSNEEATKLALKPVYGLLIAYRFKEASFIAYEGAHKVLSYTLPSKNDSELITDEELKLLMLFGYSN